MALQHIPPIQCLLTFEALARLRNAGKAADELCVTPSAISHRIRQLESQLGLRLFSRSDFTLTADGAAYLQHVRTGLAALQQMPSRSVTKGRTRLRVAITPTFARVFVMPRLELFRNAYPDIELILQVSIPLLNVTAEQADLEVRFGTGGCADVDYRMVLMEDVTPVCSPSFINDHGPFEGFETSPCAWRMKKLLGERLPVHDSIEFVHDVLLPRLTLQPQPGAVAVHPVCSVRKMGTVDKLVAIAARCSTQVVQAQAVQCCGFAGDRGFRRPELNEHALRHLKAELPEGCSGGYSTSRTCEIGLSETAAIPYQSILYLVERCSSATPPAGAPPPPP